MMSQKMMKTQRFVAHWKRLAAYSTETGSQYHYAGPNWLEKNCGDVPMQPKGYDDDSSSMLRVGHVAQISSASLLNSKVANASSKGYSPEYEEKLHELKAVQSEAVNRIENAAQVDGFRFRPSILVPMLEGSSSLLGSLLQTLGEEVSTSSITGIKIAISDHYNDQIRELYEVNQGDSPLKDILKECRDKELQFVDAHRPDALDMESDQEEETALKVAKLATKALLQTATYC